MRSLVLLLSSPIAITMMMICAITSFASVSVSASEMAGIYQDGTASVTIVGNHITVGLLPAAAAPHKYGYGTITSVDWFSTTGTVHFADTNTDHQFVYINAVKSIYWMPMIDYAIRWAKSGNDQISFSGSGSQTQMGGVYNHSINVIVGGAKLNEIVIRLSAPYDEIADAHGTITSIDDQGTRGVLTFPPIDAKYNFYYVNALGKVFMNPSTTTTTTTATSAAIEWLKTGPMTAMTDTDVQDPIPILPPLPPTPPPTPTPTLKRKESKIKGKYDLGNACVDVDGDGITITFPVKHQRPAAHGTITSVDDDGTRGHVSFPDDTSYSFYYDNGQEVIYWEAAAGNKMPTIYSRNRWVKVKSPDWL